MKKITKLLAVIFVLCGCFWVSSCSISDLFSGGISTAESSSAEMSDSESTSGDTGESSLPNEDSTPGEDSTTNDGINGGNWTGEVPLHP